MKGILEADSPAFARLLKRTVTLDKLILLREIYRFSSLNAGVEERHHDRGENTSFNPRPARLSTILIKDQEINDFEVIAGSIFFCVKEWPSIIPSKYDQIIQNIVAIQNKEKCLEEKYAPILLANLLDEIRHTPVLIEKTKDINDYKEELLDIEKNYPGCLEKYSALVTKINSAFKLYFK